MSEPRNTARIEFTCTLTLSETEIRALDALTGYGVEGFLTTFYEKMGKHYMQPHEAGMRSLFKTVGAQVSGPLKDIDRARRDLSDAIKKREADHLLALAVKAEASQ